jgi:hypothetical protein
MNPHVRGWTMSGEIEAYLTALTEAEKAASKIRLLASTLETVSSALKDDPTKAIGLIPTEWPSREQMTELITTVTKQTEMASRLYAAVPIEMRKHINSPERIGRWPIVVEE